MVIGNGGSAAIASHLAADLWKNAQVRAMTFNDPALLTSVSNNHGYAEIFERPIDMFAGSSQERLHGDHDVRISGG